MTNHLFPVEPLSHRTIGNLKNNLSKSVPHYSFSPRCLSLIPLDVIQLWKVEVDVSSGLMSETAVGMDQPMGHKSGKVKEESVQPAHYSQPS